MQEQIQLFSGLDLDRQDALLSKTLTDLEIIETLFSEMVAAWQNGDSAKLDALVRKGFEGHPHLYKLMVVERNARWLPKIIELMGRSENVLVIVGAGHLVGEDSVVDMLVKKGYSVKQQ